MQKYLKSYRVYAIKKKQCQKDAVKCTGDMDRIRNEIEEKDAQLQKLGR